MSENPLVKDKYQNYLLVEGSDDKHLFHHLLDYYLVRDEFKIKGEPFEIIEHEGIDNLLDLKTLRAYLKGNKLRRFGIVIDADIDLAVRWQKIRDILAKSGYSMVPSKPEPEGTIIKQDELPIIGVWLMPNNKVPGMLEDFVSFLVPLGDLLWPIAEDVVQKVIVTDRRFPQAQTIKANIHTWLAWQEEPGKPMGQAITKRYLDASALHAQQLMNWIRQLFDLGST